MSRYVVSIKAPAGEVWCAGRSYSTITGHCYWSWETDVEKAYRFDTIVEARRAVETMTGTRCIYPIARAREHVRNLKGAKA